MAESILLRTPPSIPDPPEPLLEEVLPNVELIEDDGEPMESDWHVKAMVLLMACIDEHLRDRDDYYAAGNMFIYYSVEQARNRDFRGPDFFFLWNTNRFPIRRYWATWLENGRTPDVVVELSSPSTIDQDHGTKKKIYETVLRVGDYFCYDPETQRVEGWRLKEKKYEPITPNEKGWVWSAELGLWLGTWTGKVGRITETWLRFYDAQGRLVLFGEEAQRERADSERERADTEQRLRESAEAELKQLRERLSQQQTSSPIPLNGAGHS